MMLASITCIILFTLFTLIYLIVFQADILAYSQQILSNGATTYSPVMGGLIITGLTVVLGFIVRRMLPKNLMTAPALSYLPSALVVASIASCHPVTNTNMEFSGAIIWSILILLLTVAIVWLAAKVSPFSPEYPANQLLFRTLWTNTLVMAAIFMAMVFVGNSNEYDHLRLRTEKMILSDDVTGAVGLTKDNSDKDTTMLMLRAYAFGKHRQLGSSFFTPFPHHTSSERLFPVKTNNLSFLTTDADRIYDLIGGEPDNGMSVVRTLEKLSSKGRLTKTGQQYLLTAYLLDRDLPSFIKFLPKVYDDNQQLPRNFAEAVVLYKSMNKNYKPDYKLGDAEGRYASFCSEKKLMDTNSKTKANGRRLYWHSLSDDFGDTYFYYYVSK